MSRFLNVADAAHPAVAELESLLARLPDEWLVCRGCRIPGDDGPAVAFILLHPDLGVALVDLAPAPSSHAAVALSRSMESSGILRVPVVAVPVAPEEIPIVGDRLGEAFRSAAACAANDPDWALRVIDLLLSAEDAPMLPLPAVELASAVVAPSARTWRQSTGAKALMLLCGIVVVDAVVVCLAAQQPRQESALKEEVARASVALPAPVAADVQQTASAASPADGDSALPDAAAALEPLPIPEPRASAAQPAHRVEKHAARRHVSHRALHSRVGNDARAGRFYDENDAWLGPSGWPRPGAPVLRQGG
jgi:hypothetical protein